MPDSDTTTAMKRPEVAALLETAREQMLERVRARAAIHLSVGDHDQVLAAKTMEGEQPVPDGAIWMGLRYVVRDGSLLGKTLRVQLEMLGETSPLEAPVAHVLLVFHELVVEGAAEEPYDPRIVVNQLSHLLGFMNYLATGLRNGSVTESFTF